MEFNSPILNLEKEVYWLKSHNDRTGEYAAVIAQNLGLEKKFIENLRFAGHNHDIGKELVNREILLKRSSLTKSEFEQIKLHTYLGRKFIEYMASQAKNSNGEFKTALEVALYHHENMDGTGYPYGFKGDEIPLSARILSIVDRYDALTNIRPYRKPLSHEQAMDIITKGDGRIKPQHFDMELLKIFIRISDIFPVLAKTDINYNSISLN